MISGVQQRKRWRTLRWLQVVACVLAAISLVRALVLQYLVPADSVWNVARVGLSFAAFAITGRFAMALVRNRVNPRDGIASLVLPVVLVAIARLQIGAPLPAVVASATVAVAGGLAGAIIAALAVGSQTADGE